MKKEFKLLYIRNFIFGAEDSLVSTVGMLAGISSAGIGSKEIAISGVVLISVEAFSMAVGSFLSERETEESLTTYDIKRSRSLSAAVVMLFSYVLCGLVPLLPYLLGLKDAFAYSIIATLIALFALGYFSAEMLKTKMLKSALRMLIIGGAAVALGIFVGIALK
jgi:VIT1/CCC1 family predicted Fe2+/Mn2+ transporter